MEVGKISKNRIWCCYTMPVSVSRSVARIHIESARRLLKPDGNYNSSNEDIVETAQRLVEFIADENKRKVGVDYFTVTISSTYHPDHCDITHVFESINRENITITEAV